MTDRQVKLLQLRCDVESHDNTVTDHSGVWGLAWGRALTPQLYFSALLAWPGLPSPSCTGTVLAVYLNACTAPHHMHRQLLEPCPAKVSGNFCHWLWCRQDFRPWTHTHLLPDACACECLCIYISFTVQSTYRKASSLFKHFTSCCMKSDPNCHSHSFSQLNGVTEPFLLQTAAITIRLGGRGNEQCSTRCTFQPPAIVKSTLLQTEWQRGTGWEAGVTCQEHQSSSSRLNSDKYPYFWTASCHQAERGFKFLLLNTWKFNKCLHGKPRGHFLMSALWSFICSVTNHDIAFHLQQFALGGIFPDALLWFGFFIELQSLLLACPACAACFNSILFKKSH